MTANDPPPMGSPREPLPRRGTPGPLAAPGPIPVSGNTPYLAPGQRIGRFRVDVFIAQGGMGEVYRGYDEQLQRRVALKTIRSDWVGEAQVLVRFQREAQILAKLNHPGICQVFDLIEQQGHLVLAMEWVEGRPLSEALTIGTQSVGSAVGIAKAIAEALVAAHGKGIIHRDLKPSNVMVLPDGGVKVLDFGLAVSQGDDQASDSPTQALQNQDPKALKALIDTEATTPIPLGAHPQKLSETGAVMGTFSYMAPEVFCGGRASTASDMFSFGVVLHELFEGCPPFPGKGATLMRNVLEGRRNPTARRTPKSLRALQEALLHKEPEHRPAAGEALQVLAQWGRPLGRGWWAASAAALTLLAAGLGLWAYSRGALQEFTTVRKARIVVAPILNPTQTPDLGPLTLSTTDLLEQGLQRFPKLLVVRDQEPGKARPRLEARGADAEKDFLAGVAARTGADLILLGEVLPRTDPNRSVLAIRLVDRRGAARVIVQAPSPTDRYEPHLAVPALLAELWRKLAPLGGPPDLPDIPTAASLRTYGKGLEIKELDGASGALPLLESASLEAPRFTPAVLEYAWCLRALSDSKALPTYQWARAIARESGDRQGQARALLGLARINHDQGLASAVDEQLHEARTLAVDCRNPDLEALVLNDQATVAIDRGERGRAKPLLERALALLTSAGNRRYRFSILINLANLAKYEGDTREAHRLYTEVYEDAVITRSLYDQAVAKNNLGIVELDAGNPVQAEHTLEAALALRRESRDPDGEARTLQRLGIAAYMQGHLDDAARRFEASRALANQHQLLQVEGRALFRIGDVLRTQGRFEAARPRLEQSLVILQQGGKGTPENVAEALAALAECAARTGNLEEAERRLRLIEPAAAAIPQVWRARAWMALRRGDRPQALAHLAKALEDPKKFDPDHRTEVEALLASWRSRP